jgi:hypothetical protein
MTNASLFKILYRILAWSSLAGFVLVLILVLRKSPPPDVPYDPKAAARVEQKFAAADEANASGQPAHVQLDRTELNSYLQQDLEPAGHLQSTAPATAPSGGTPSSTVAPSASGAQPNDQTTGLLGSDQPTLEQVQSSVKDVRVDMEGDLVKAYVVFDSHGKDLSLELEGHLRTEGGYLKFEPVSGKLGSLPLPQSVLDSAVEKLMASPENREKLRLPEDISDIQIVNGQAVVSYK